MYLDVKTFVRNWKDELKSKIARMDKFPTLTIIQIGDYQASTKYVDNKIKDCNEVGIRPTLYRIPKDSCPTTVQLAQIINQDESNGLIVQLPVPKELDVNKAIQAALSPERDVDGFLPDSPHNPATAQGIITYLDSLGMGDGTGLLALVIGRGPLAGKPTAKLLLDRNWTVVQAHSRTNVHTLDEMVAKADLIVCAVGRAHFLDATMAKKDAVIIDVGTNWDGSKLVGDVYNGVSSEAKVTPVPGGVGLLTRCALLENVVKAKEIQSENL